MKKLTILFLTLTLLLASMTNVYGYYGKYGKKDSHWKNDNSNDNHYYNHQSSRMDARRVLQRTAQYLMEAQRVARNRGNYYQGLGKALAHQNRAKQLYEQGWYDRAIVHSISARKIAIDILRQNRARFDEHNAFNDYNRRFERDYNDNDLDAEIYFNMIDDNEALQIYIDLD